MANPITDPYPVLSPDELPKSLKGPIRDLIGKALERDPDDRWGSARDMVVTINKILKT